MRNKHKARRNALVAKRQHVCPSNLKRPKNCSGGKKGLGLKSKHFNKQAQKRGGGAAKWYIPVKKQGARRKQWRRCKRAPRTQSGVWFEGVRYGQERLIGATHRGCPRTRLPTAHKTTPRPTTTIANTALLLPHPLGSDFCLAFLFYFYFFFHIGRIRPSGKCCVFILFFLVVWKKSVFLSIRQIHNYSKMQVGNKEAELYRHVQARKQAEYLELLSRSNDEVCYKGKRALVSFGRFLPSLNLVASASPKPPSFHGARENMEWIYSCGLILSRFLGDHHPDSSRQWSEAILWMAAPAEADWQTNPFMHNVHSNPPLIIYNSPLIHNRLSLRPSPFDQTRQPSFKIHLCTSLFCHTWAQLSCDIRSTWREDRLWWIYYVCAPAAGQSLWTKALPMYNHERIPSLTRNVLSDALNRITAGLLIYASIIYPSKGTDNPRWRLQQASPQSQCHRQDICLSATIAR